jgi:acetoacetyl-CoA synthetase
MPIFFWNDDKNQRYHDSYFGHYKGIWRHGDWIEVTKNDGIIIYGRSDATLNRGGVRIGTAEVYRAVEQLPEVQDSLVIGLELPEGRFWMPMFVVLAKGHKLNDALKKKVASTLRQQYTPRHVPDELLEVSEIPYTISGKKMEAPVKKILLGKDISKSLNADAMRNPESLEFFRELYKKRD